MSVYQQPFTPAEVSDAGTPLRTNMQVAQEIISITFVNTSPYWFRISNRVGQPVSYLPPNSKGNDNFTEKLTDQILIERDLSLPPVTQGIAANIVLLRFNTAYSTGASLTDYNVPTGAGTEAQNVTLVNPLPGGTNHIGSVAIDGSLPTGTNNIGNVGLLPGAEVIASITGTPNVNVDSIAPGSNLIGKVDINGNATLSTNMIINGGSVTTALTALPSQICKGGLLQAPDDNTAKVLIGDGVTGVAIWELSPGGSFVFAGTNLNQLAVRSATGTQNINWALGV